jgi:hypothetical protein
MKDKARDALDATADAVKKAAEKAQHAAQQASDKTKDAAASQRTARVRGQSVSPLTTSES